MPFFLRSRSLASRPGTSPCHRRKSAGGGRREDFGARTRLSPVSEEASEGSDTEMTSHKLSTALPDSTTRPSLRVSRSSFEATRRERHHPQSGADKSLNGLFNKGVSQKLIGVDKRTKHYLKDRAEKMRRKVVLEKGNPPENSVMDKADQARRRGRSVIRFTLQEGLISTVSELEEAAEETQKGRARSALPSLTRGDGRQTTDTCSPSDVDRYHDNDVRPSTSHLSAEDANPHSGDADRTSDSTLVTPRLSSPTPGNRRGENLSVNHVPSHRLQRELAKLDLRDRRRENGTMSGGDWERAAGSGIKAGERGGSTIGISLLPELSARRAGGVGGGAVTSQRSGGLPVVGAHSHSWRGLASPQPDVSTPPIKAAAGAAGSRTVAAAAAPTPARASHTLLPSHAAPAPHSPGSPRANTAPRPPSPRTAQHRDAGSPPPSGLSPEPSRSPVTSPSPTGFFNSLYSALSAARLSGTFANMNSQEQLLTRARRSTAHPWTPRSSQLREPAHVRLARPKMARPTLRRPVTQTATTRKSNMSGSAGSAVGTAGTSTSGESQPPETLEEYERRLTVEKCLRWMETLPDKFTGLHIVMSPGPSTDDS